MSKPTIRMLAALELLQRHGRISGARLAEHLGIDRRSVRRYIVMLEEMGIPIVTERGREGAYALVAGFKLPPMMFTEEEALAVSLGLIASRQIGLGETTAAISSAQAKLERVLPSKLRNQVSKLSDAITLDGMQSNTQPDAKILALLSTAAQSRMRVVMKYRSSESKQRSFDCYGLVYRSGYWYSVGYCHLRKELRSFRLDRIDDVKLSDVSFVRPKEFNAARELLRSIATLPRKHSIEVLLKININVARANVLPSVALLESFGENTLLRAEADDLDWFAGQLARLDCDFEIRKPAALKSAVRRLANRLLASA